MKRSSPENSSNTEETQARKFELSFTSTQPDVTEHLSYPQNDEEFWSDKSVLYCGSTLQVRKYSVGDQEIIFLRRKNQKRSPTNLQFPASLVSTFVERIEALLQRLERKPNGQYQLSTLKEVTTDFSKETFWESEEAFQIGSLWVRPFLSKFGIQIRLWQQLQNGEYREFVDREGKEIKWYGSNNTISVKCLELLKDVLIFFRNEVQEDN